jgi:hypothetical protein
MELAHLPKYSSEQRLPCIAHRSTTKSCISCVWPTCALQRSCAGTMFSPTILQWCIVEHMLLLVDPSGHANLIKMMSGLDRYSRRVTR